MGTTDIGQNTNGRLNHSFQSSHLPHLGNAGFENTQFGFFRKLPHRKWDSNLRIITAWRANDATIRAKQLVQPLLHNGFSITAGDTDHRDLKFITMCFGKLLQSFQRIGNDEEVERTLNSQLSILNFFKVFFRNYKITYAPVI